MKNTSRRPLAIGAAIAASAIVVSGAGVGYAANGGSFLLGRVNDATQTTILNNSASTPLKLVGPAAKAPMVVSSDAKVNRLNADLVDGLDSSAFQRRPVQTIRFAVAADETLGIGAGAAAAVIVLGVFLLRIDIGERRLDGGKLVAADAAIEDFQTPGVGVELPRAILADQRNGERKVVVPKEEHSLIVGAAPTWWPSS